LAKTHQITFLLPVERDQHADQIRVLSSFCKVECVGNNSQYLNNPNKRLVSRIYWKVNSIFPFINKIFYELTDPPVGIKEGKGTTSALEWNLNMREWSQFDLIQVEQVFLAESVRNVRVPIPKALTWHDILSAVQQREYEEKIRKGDRTRAWLQWQKLRRYESQLLSVIDQSIVTSEMDAKRLIDLEAKANPTIVPNGVDCDYFTNTAPFQEESRTLVFTGLMEYKPNIDAVTYFCEQVLPYILLVYPDLAFYIVGARPTAEVKQLSDRYPGVVNVTGSVEDVRPYLQKATLCVVPLRNGGGTRLKILEALSMQKVVVSTSIGCEGLNLTDGENIVIADNAKDFADRVLVLLSDPFFRKQIAQNGYRFVRNNYDWKIIAQKQEVAWEIAVSKYHDRASNWVNAKV
jgi:glycosyltransferase involved in cell wall biosynthesis